MRPVLTGYQEELFGIFWEVSRYRLTPEGPRPLSPSDIEVYMRLYGVSHDQLERLWWHLRRIDDVFCELYVERQRQLIARETGGSGGGDDVVEWSPGVI